MEWKGHRGTLMTETISETTTPPAAGPSPSATGVPRRASLLARIADHLRNQHWTAIAIEFLVVVFGVFLGFQLNTWSEANRARAEEQRIIGQLQLELEAAIASREASAATFEQHWSTFGDAVMAVQDESIPALSPAECQSIWTSHIFNFAVVHLATLDEILSTGSIGELQNPHLRKALLDYDAFRADTADQYQFIRQDFANLIDVHSHAFPRTLRDKPTMATLATIGQDIIPIDSSVACRLDLIRADPVIRNKLVSNLARTTAIVQSTRDELARIRKLDQTLTGLAR